MDTKLPIETNKSSRRKLIFLKIFITLAITMLSNTNLFSQSATGCISGNCNNGWGVYVYENGNKYVGEFKNSEKSGYGFLTYKSGVVYTGEFKNNKLSGRGVCKWTSGEKYIGDWINNEMNGDGIYFYTDGSKKYGKWKDNSHQTSDASTGCVSGDCENGYGVYLWSYTSEWAGDKYEGYWKDGYRNGKGTYYYKSGSKVVGNFKNNKIDGYATYWWYSGDKYEGDWKEGKRHGQGTYYYPSGTIEKGTFEYDDFKGSSNVVNNDYNNNNNNNNNINYNNNKEVTKTGCISGDCSNGYGVYVFKSGEKYEGYWKSDKRNGQGTNKYAKGNVYVGEWLDDQQHGYGTTTYASGDKYVGNYSYHKRSGFGTYTFVSGKKYVGEWKNNMYDGQGTLYEKDGTIKSGTWKEDVFVGSNSNDNNITTNTTGCISGNCDKGYGTYVFASGEKYIGYWVDNMRNGQGTNYFASGAIYTGEWKNDKKHGYGTFTYKQSSQYDKYIGNFIEENLEGQGTLTYKNGDKYKGEFKNNMFNGEGTMTYKDGTTKSGIWKDDNYVGKSQDNYGCITGNCTNGYGTYTWSNGSKYVGYWTLNKMDGQGTYFSANGDKYIGNFKEGTYNGYGTYTFAVDNRKYVGEWKDGLYHGKGTMYYSNNTTKSGNWANGEFVNENVTEELAEITWENPEYFTANSTSSTFNLKLCIKSKSPITKADIYVNDVIQVNNATRGYNVVAATCDFTIEKPINLISGENKVKVVIQNKAGSKTSDIRTITYTAGSKEKKLALVMGNSNYSSAPLKNPANDAKAIAKALQDLGFEVMVYTDLSVNDMKKHIRSFGEKLSANKGIGLFYYAGHGIQYSGENYLIPVDAKIEKEQDIEYESVNLKRVLGEMDYAQNNMNIVILDACRNNPFARSFRSSANNGLATTTAPQGTMIAYSTAPGSVASDGSGNNGLYTEELLKAITKPGLKIEDVFKQVRLSVYEKSNKQQIPWENSSIFGDFYFKK